MEQQKTQNLKDKNFNKMLNAFQNKIPTAIFSLGGIQEIGKNTYVMEHGDEIWIIDAGIKFPEDWGTGIEGIIPNYQWLKENESKIQGLIITHGHEDHIGGIPYLLKEIDLKCIYAPRFAQELIKAKLRDKKVVFKGDLNLIDGDTVIKTKNFLIDFYSINHSIPDAYGSRYRTINGTIVTTGDFKFDYSPIAQKTDFWKIARIGQEKVDLFISDSTNSLIPGITPSEKDVMARIEEIFRKSLNNRIILAAFASNVYRLKTIVDCAIKYNRKILIFGRSMKKGIDIARKIKYIKAPLSVFVENRNLHKYKPHEILILSTGSQGEPLAALSRIAQGIHPYVTIQKNDIIVFSSSPIPGSYARVENLTNKLIKLGAVVLENSAMNTVHTSGHASQGDQKLMFNLIKPVHFAPMHGEYRMLAAHIDTAVSTGVDRDKTFLIHNGDRLELLNGKVTQSESVPAEPIYIDGNDITGHTRRIISDRNKLGKDGLISVVITIDSRKNVIIGKPKIISRGTFYVKNSLQTIIASQKIALSAVKDYFQTAQKVTFSGLKQSIQKRLLPYIHRTKKRDPILIPVILNIANTSLSSSAKPATKPTVTVVKPTIATVNKVAKKPLTPKPSQNKIKVLKPSPKKVIPKVTKIKVIQGAPKSEMNPVPKPRYSKVILKSNNDNKK